MVGRADDLTVDDMQQVITQVFGTAQPETDALADTAKIATVREALNALPAPKIQSAVAPDQSTDTSDGTSREENQRSFRVMGQRYIPDSYAFQQLVWDHVGTGDNKRTLPMGLDIMTVLGSDEAYRLETELYGQQQYAGWDAQVQKVKQEFTQAAPTCGPTNLYTGWLESLQLVMKVPGSGAPAFMRSQPWALKSLNTALGQLDRIAARHHLVCQTVGDRGGGGWRRARFTWLCGAISRLLHQDRRVGRTPLNKVSPQYWPARLRLGRQTRQNDLARAGVGDHLSEGAGRHGADRRRDLSHPDLRPGARGPGEVRRRTSRASRSRPPPRRAPWWPTCTPTTSPRPPRRWKRRPATRCYLYAALEVDGALQLFIGASYSYYEFTAPIERRLTDEEWIALLDSGEAPPRPQWTDEWIVQR